MGADLIKHGRILSLLTKLHIIKNDIKFKGKEANSFVIRFYGDISVFIPEAFIPSNKLKFKVSFYQTLDIILLSITENKLIRNQIFIPLEKYMKLRGLTFKKKAVIQLKQNLLLLSQITINGNEKQYKKKQKDILFNSSHLITDFLIRKNGDIIITISDDFLNYLKNKSVMKYHKKLLKINPHKNPNSYFFLRRILEHNFMNKRKDCINVIPVRTLLNISELPLYEKVKQTRQSFIKKIINPFFRDLSALNDVLDWELTDGEHVINVNPTEVSRMKNFSFSFFSGLKIKVKWKNETKTELTETERNEVYDFDVKETEENQKETNNEYLKKINKGEEQMEHDRGIFFTYDFDEDFFGTEETEETEKNQSQITYEDLLKGLLNE